MESVEDANVPANHDSRLEDLMVRLLRARITIFLTCLSLGLATFLFVLLFAEPVHTASLRFFITQDNSLAPEELLKSGTNVYGDPTTTDFHLLHLQSFGSSSEVLERVVDSLDLVNHYGLDGSEARAEAADALYRKLTITITHNKELLVEVRDREMEVAVTAANIIMSNINTMNNSHMLIVMLFQFKNFTANVTIIIRYIALPMNKAQMCF